MHSVPDIINNKQIKLSTSTPNKNVLLNNVQYIGSVGQHTFQTINKDQELPVIASLNTDIFLILIKRSILQWFLQTINDILDNNTKSDLEKELKLIISNIYEDISSVLGNDYKDKSFILLLAGKYIDGIISQYISESVINKTNTLIYELSGKDPDTMPEDYRNISQRKSTENTVISLGDNNFIFDMNETFDDLLSFFNKMRNIVSNSYINILGSNLNMNPVKNDDIIKVVNFNYDISSLEEICFKIDDNIIKLLLDNKADVNAKDNIGNSPIFYAIELQSPSIIKLLIKYGAIKNEIRGKNKNGLTPLEFTIKQASDSINKIQSKKEICKYLTDNLLENFRKKYNNNVPRYSDIILDVSLYLLNHHFYLISQKYPNNWTFNDQQSLNKLISSNDFSNYLPILDITTSKSTIGNMDLTNQRLENFTSDIDKYNVIVNKLKNSNQQYNSEIIHLKSKNIPTYKSRIDDLTELIKKNSLEIKKYDELVKATNKSYKSVLNTSNQAFNFLKNKFVNNKLLSGDSASKIYESVFIDVINKNFNSLLRKGLYNYKIDLKTYPMFWNTFLKSNNSDDTQIIDKLFSYQKQLISKSIQDNLSNYSIIDKYFNSVIVPFIKNYFDLPKEYNASNYCMTEIINIITHIVARIMIPNMFGAILKIIIKYISGMYPKSSFGSSYPDEKYQKYIVSLVINLIDPDVSVRASNLMNYMFDILPLKLVKVVLQVFEGSDDGSGDVDKNERVESLFDHINSIIVANTTVNISDKSFLLNTLKQDIYPYYADYFTMFIKEIKKVIDGYLRSILFQANNISMIAVSL